MGKFSTTIGLLVFLGLIMSPYSFSKTAPIKSVIIHTELEFSKENLIKVINESNIEHKDIFLAQIIKESGNFTSDIFINANNLTGMRLPAKRETLAVGSYKGYAAYDCWTHSVGDYFLWQQRIIIKYRTKDSYLSYIGRVYAKDTMYLKEIKEILHQNKEFFKKVLE